MATTGPKTLNWQNVDLDDAKELHELMVQLAEVAGERGNAAVKDLQDRGILDEQGNRIRTDVPLDMLPASKTDYGG